MEENDHQKDLFSEYREVTRQSGPPDLAAAVRRRLARPHLILPRVAFACLTTATAVTAAATFLLITRQFPQPETTLAPPPLFQPAQSAVFSDPAPFFPK